jgi:hypothetical protein
MKHMPRADGYTIYEQDRLVTRWRKKGLGQWVFYHQGKRVPADCPLALKYRRVYVKHGIVFCVEAMREDNPTLTINECFNLLNQARY